MSVSYRSLAERPRTWEVALFLCTSLCFFLLYGMLGKHPSEAEDRKWLIREIDSTRPQTVLGVSPSLLDCELQEGLILSEVWLRRLSEDIARYVARSKADFSFERVIKRSLKSNGDWLYRSGGAFRQAKFVLPHSNLINRSSAFAFDRDCPERLFKYSRSIQCFDAAIWSQAALCTFCLFEVHVIE